MIPKNKEVATTLRLYILFTVEKTLAIKVKTFLERTSVMSTKTSEIMKDLKSNVIIVAKLL